MKKERDINIEFIRVIACIFVIGLHISLGFLLESNELDKTRLFISSLLRDGVTLFWFIMGYFLFYDKRSFKEIIKKCLSKVFLPAFIIMIFTVIFNNWIISSSSFIDCIKNISINNFIDIFKCLLFLTIDPIPSAAHLWYIFAYIKVIIWYPILKLVVNKKNDNIVKYIIIVSSIFIFTNFIQILFFKEILYEEFIITTIPIIQVLIGYKLRNYIDKNKKIIKTNKYRIIFLSTLIVAYIMRFGIQLLLYYKNNDLDYMLHTGRLLNFVIAISLFLFIMSINIKDIFKKIILFLSKNTFYIYLLHFCLILKFKSFGLDTKLLSKLPTNVIGEILYTLIYTLFIFIVCLIISVIIHYIEKYIKKIFNH